MVVNLGDSVNFYSNCNNYHNIYGGVVIDGETGEDEAGVSHNQNVKFLSKSDNCIS